MTTPLTMTQARAMTRDLASRWDATVVDSDSPASVAARAMVDALQYLVPETKAPVEIVSQHLGGLCVTLPLGDLGTYIFLSERVNDSAVDYAETGAHEVHHALGIAQAGTKQTAVDYLGDRNLRAAEEARAEVVAMFTRRVLTGELRSVDAVAAELHSRIYFLGDNHIRLGRGIIEAAHETIQRDGMPNSSICLAVYQWLTKHAPDAIVAPVRLG